MTTLLLVDDHPLIRRGVRHLLAAERPTWSVLAEAADGRDAIVALARHRADVVLLDLSLPDVSGLEVLRQVPHLSRGSRPVVLTMHEDRAYVEAARVAGARAFVAKDTLETALIDTIELVLAGGTAFGQGLGQGQADVASADPLAGLSAREREVLFLSIDGSTAVEVGERLRISPRTVEVHRSRIYEELGLDGLHDLIAFAHRSRIIVDT